MLSPKISRKGIGNKYLPGGWFAAIKDFKKLNTSKFLRLFNKLTDVINVVASSSPCSCGLINEFAFH